MPRRAWSSRSVAFPNRPSEFPPQARSHPPTRDASASHTTTGSSGRSAPGAGRSPRRGRDTASRFASSDTPAASAAPISEPVLVPTTRSKAAPQSSRSGSPPAASAAVPAAARRNSRESRRRPAPVPGTASPILRARTRRPCPSCPLRGLFERLSLPPPTHFSPAGEATRHVRPRRPLIWVKRPPALAPNVGTRGRGRAIRAAVLSRGVDVRVAPCGSDRETRRA